MQQLAEIIEATPDIKEKYAQTAMLKIFNLLGEGNELIKKYRPLLKQYAH